LSLLLLLLEYLPVLGTAYAIVDDPVAYREYVVRSSEIRAEHAPFLEFDRFPAGHLPVAAFTSHQFFPSSGSAHIETPESKTPPDNSYCCNLFKYLLVDFSQKTTLDYTIRIFLRD
jgi:hypothetical protein